MAHLDFVHHFVPGATPDAPVFLLLHGTGGDEADLLSLGRELDATAALLSPRGKVSENGAPRFFRRLAEGVFDEEDVVKRAHQLADFAAASALEYGFPLAQLTAVGYSNGANIAAAMLLLRPENLPRAILFRAMVPLAQATIGDLANVRVLISSGAFDPIVPLENPHRLAAMLKEGGAVVSLEIQQAGHGLVPGDMETAKRWLQT